MRGSRCISKSRLAEARYASHSGSTTPKKFPNLHVAKFRYLQSGELNFSISTSNLTTHRSSNIVGRRMSLATKSSILRVGPLVVLMHLPTRLEILHLYISPNDQ